MILRKISIGIKDCETMAIKKIESVEINVKLAKLPEFFLKRFWKNQSEEKEKKHFWNKIMKNYQFLPFSY